MTDRMHSREGSESSLNNAIVSPRSSAESRSPSARTQLRVSHMPPSNHQHRPSLSESLRGPPGSPRARRQPSLPQSALQSLIDNPPPPKATDPAFVGRDWRKISIGELVSPDDLKFVELDTGVEEATNILIDSGAPVLLIRETPESTSAVATFDYSDLNSYLLLAAGLTSPDEAYRASYDALAKKAHDGVPIPLRDVKKFGMEKEPLINLPTSANVLNAVEIFGGGVHRVVVVNESNDKEVVGIFSQFRLVKFLWENGRSFPIIEELYPKALRELVIGSHEVISINGDKPLSDALHVMNNEGMSSIVVVDNYLNVLGNISTADVKLLTRSSSLPLLHNTCTNFISVILSTRGLVEGKDSFPVFHVNPGSTLAHTVAKIVATRSHRLWVTDPSSPASSGPPTPSHSSVHIPISSGIGPTTGSQSANSPPPSPLPAPVTPSAQPSQYTAPHLPAPNPPYTFPATGVPAPMPSPISHSIPSAALDGARLSGRLVGVVSLTDILNLHARASGLNPADPSESRNRRRRSSSSSQSVRRSGDIGRELFSRGGM
ncbi:Major facilitator superfamily domain general substrate transporter [Penicillium paradoxum]|uniref:Major facilitator superfamily domain general substrate transporter n=1 Tax=Penicillium paradoxum TaxID=176176 RepID=UPI002546A472|nr:Major facilitator superfamily domain general substrate transporter [Penicillium paradoxum]KAJ5774468.1 Major facilitator superfamily domain general substrate transporter [Penicillium paradoxum]